MVGRKLAQKESRPPARLRYEHSHPTVSFRLERGLWNELRAYLSQRRISCSEFIREAMGAQKALIKDTEEARLDGYKRGYQKAKAEGQRDAKKALDNERGKLREERETVARKARDDGYREGFEKGRLEERKHSQKTLNEEIAGLRAEMEESGRKAEDQGRKQGYSEGYTQAKEMYLVSYDCAFCGEAIEVRTEQEKSAIRRAAREYEWAHENCWAREEQRRRAQEAERLEKEARRKEFEARYGTRAMERGFNSDTGQA